MSSIFPPGSPKSLWSVFLDTPSTKPSLFINTTLKNYSQQNRQVSIVNQLVDAKGIARLWEAQRIRLREIAMLAVVVFAAFSPILAVFLLSPAGRNWLKMVQVFFGIRFR